MSKKEWWEEDTSDLRKELGLINRKPEPLPEKTKPYLARLKRIQSQTPKTLDELPRLVPLHEVYARCQFRATTFYELVKKGKFKPVKSGRRTFVPEDQLIRYLLEILGYEKKTRTA